MRNVKIYEYADFGGVLRKGGCENGFDPLPDHLASEPD